MSFFHRGKNRRAITRLDEQEAWAVKHWDRITDVSKVCGVTVTVECRCGWVDNWDEGRHLCRWCDRVYEVTILVEVKEQLA